MSLDGETNKQWYVNECIVLTVLPYHRDLPIRNTQSLPSGRGCRWLLCIRGEGADLVAKHWCRKLPKDVGANEVIVEFRPRTLSSVGRGNR